MDMVTYARQRERVGELTAALDRISHRLRQGAIDPEQAAKRLRLIAQAVELELGGAEGASSEGAQ